MNKFEKKPKIYDDTRLFQYGIFMLSRRDYSRHELGEKMQKWQPDKSIIEKILDKLQGSGYLSDKRKAQSMLIQYGNKESPKKTIQRMKQKGIDSEAIEEALGNVEDNSSTVCSSLLQKKFKHYCKESHPKYVRFLASKGFSYNLIKNSIDEFANNG